jgi:hypothetical protein
VADYQVLVTMIANRDPTPTADMVEKARLALKANIEWREKKGHVVRVLKGPYHENLRSIHRVLEIDGGRTRMVLPNLKASIFILAKNHFPIGRRFWLTSYDQRHIRVGLKY